MSLFGQKMPWIAPEARLIFLAGLRRARRDTFSLQPSMFGRDAPNTGTPASVGGASAPAGYGYRRQTPACRGIDWLSVITRSPDITSPSTSGKRTPNVEPRDLGDLRRRGRVTPSSRVYK